jgi:predicted transposase YbfD/YdcC
MEEEQTLAEYLASIRDPRVERTKRHKLIDILIIGVCSVICGAETWEEMELFGRSKEEWFKSFLELPNGIPSHDTIARVFARIDPNEFRESFLGWIGSVYRMTGKQVIAIDGKQSRRSHDRRNGKGAVQMVSAWARDNGLVLGQKKVADKSNEITAIPELLKILAISGCIVTIDAMGCQTEIASQIVEKEGDYVLAVKGNQGMLLDDLTRYFDWALQDKFKQTSYTYHETVDSEHGREERRRYWSSEDIAWIRNKGAWKNLNSITMVESERTIEGETSREKRYYISSLAGEAKQIGEAIRGHWSIENSLHWVLDVAFHEDQSRIRKDHAPENMATLRHIALNLLKQDKASDKVSRVGIKSRRLKAGWNETYLLKVLGF